MGCAPGPESAAAYRNPKPTAEPGSANAKLPEARSRDPDRNPSERWGGCPYTRARMFARLVPGPLVRLFARRYVAGGSLDEAMETARALYDDRLILSTLDLLGEAVTELDEVEANVRTYKRVIESLATDARFARGGYQPWGRARPTVSLKPTAFTVGPVEDATPRITDLVEYASARDVGVTIDMEDHRYTDYTIDLTTALYARGLDVGTVLQTRLHRTEADLARIPAGMRLRLVIGIYPEDASIALTRKPPMKARMVEYARTLLEAGAKVEFATHDEATVEAFIREVVPLAPERCEVQMLLGVPRDGLIRRIRANAFGAMPPIRLYVPFTDDWDDATAYLRRRMAESPNMIWLVLRNLLPRRS